MSSARSKPAPLLEGDMSSTPQEAVLVDAEANPGPAQHELMTDDDLELMRAASAAARTAQAASLLTISRASLNRAREVRQTFDAASDGDPAEGLLEQLVAGEVGIGHELQDLEAVATALLVRTIDNPEMALHVARVAREVVSLSSAVRRRTENTLGAIAGLRAQRLLLAAQRGRRLGG